MILTVLRLNWLNLRRDGIAWLLAFIVPVVFFSIFAVIMGGMGGKDGMPRVRVAVVDEDGSDFSRRLVTALGEEKSLSVVATRKANGRDAPLTRADAEAMVRNGNVPAAVILPKGLSVGFPRFDDQGPAIEVLGDTSDQVASQMIAGLLQKVVMTGAPDAFVKGGIDQFEKHAGGLTEAQRKAIDHWLPRLKERGAKKEGAAKAGGDNAAQEEFGLVPVKVVDLLGETKQNPVIAFYAAATAVMFLLFSCANGGGGSLLEEVESGTLDRLLSSRLGMTQLLLGKWLWFTLLGVAQVTIMFLWGALVFRVDLFGHIPGFLIMTVTTAAAGSAFGLILGTLCRSRGQLAGVSTTVILIMSALGGSMFPRFLMGPTLQKIGLFTFNGWALDGYQKVFWYETPLWELWPQVSVLVALALVFLVAARFLARRWEMV